MSDSAQSLNVRRSLEVDRCCDRFETDWRAGQRRSLEDSLGSVEDEVKDDCLKALLELELELRRSAGETPSQEEYIVRFKDRRHVVLGVFHDSRDDLPGDADSSLRPTETRANATTGQQVVGAIPRKFGRYLIDRQIGRGAMGRVFLAEDTALGRKVALKIPSLTGTHDAEQIERFRREAQATGVLRHPNICPTFDFGEVDGTYFIAMAWIDGAPMSTIISAARTDDAEQPDSGTRLDEGRIVQWVRKLALAFAEAHHKGIVHRDIKPANVMVDRNDEPIVMDFGLAMTTQPSSDVRLTQTGMQMGSPVYMSPEQVDGDKHRISPRSDIYSLGVLFYELLTGKVPFEGPVASVLVQVITKEPASPSELRSGLPQELETLCLRMMSKQPDDRPNSMTEVAESLQRFNATTTSSETIPLAAVTSTSRLNFDTRREATHEAELRNLMADISTALREHRNDEVLEKVERVLELQPNNPAMLQLRKKLNASPKGRNLTISSRSVKLLWISRQWQRVKDSPLRGYILVGFIFGTIALSAPYFLDRNPNSARNTQTASVELKSGRSQIVDQSIAGTKNDRPLAKTDPAPVKEVSATVRVSLGETLEDKLAGVNRREVIELTILGPVSDLTALTQLSGLQHLDITDTPVSNISQLAQLTSLQTLDLRSTQVIDLTPLAQLTSLQSLVLSETRVSDLTPLAQLTSLKELILNGTQVNDLAPLTQLTSLQTLFLSGTQVNDLASLAQLTSLQSLHLRNTQVSDLAPLAQLTSLQLLLLSNTQVIDLTPLAQLTSLQSLFLSETRVSDVRPLAQLTKLRHLTLSSSLVTDVSALNGIEGLNIIGGPVADDDSAGTQPTINPALKPPTATGGTVNSSPTKAGSAFSDELIKMHRNQLQIRASSIYSQSWNAEKLIDGNLQTSWFTAIADSVAAGKSPWFEITFPQDVEVKRVEVMAIREPSYFPRYGTGLDVSVAKVTLSTAAGTVRRELETAAGRGSRDLMFEFPAAVDGVRRIRFQSILDSGQNPWKDIALGEIQVYPRAAAPTPTPPLVNSQTTTDTQTPPAISTPNGISATLSPLILDVTGTATLNPAQDLRWIRYAAVFAEKPAARSDWRLLVSFNSQQFENRGRQLVSNGLSLINRTSCESGGTLLHTGVFFKGSSVRFQDDHGLTANQCRTKFLTMKSRNYRPALLDGYFSGGSPRFSTLFELRSGPQWTASIGLTTQEFQSAFDQQALAGYMPADICVYPSNLGYTYGVIWEKKSQSSDWHVHHGYSAARFRQAMTDLAKTGFRPTRIAATTTGTQATYSGIWEKHDGRKWFACFDMTARELVRVAESLKLQGLTPVDFTSFTIGNNYNAELRTAWSDRHPSGQLLSAALSGLPVPTTAK